MFGRPFTAPCMGIGDMPPRVILPPGACAAGKTGEALPVSSAEARGLWNRLLSCAETCIGLLPTQKSMAIEDKLQHRADFIKWTSIVRGIS